MEDATAVDSSSNDVSVDEVSAVVPPQPLAEELVAKAIAPVKRDFLRPPPLRACDRTENNKADDKADAQKDGVSVPIIRDKKSKRQLKRERRQVRKRVVRFCQLIAWYMK